MLNAPRFASSLLLFLALIVPQGLVLAAPASAVTAKPADWIENGNAQLGERRYSEALYCFYMAAFHDPRNPQARELIEKTKALVRQHENSAYVIPREPQNFHYVLFRTQTESTMEDTGETGEVLVHMRDGSSINVANYINKLRNRRRGDEESPGDGRSADAGTVLRRGHTGEKVIALTFDDGPNPKYTPKLLDALKRHDVKATFFVVGTNAREYPSLVRRLADEGHLVANHSDRHPNMARMSEAKIRHELEAVDEALAAEGVPAPRFFRPPYGAMSKSLIGVCREMGKRVVLWSVDTNDWRKPSASKMLSRLLSSARPGDVILMHDIHPQCLYVIDPLIEAMQEAGYRFVLLDELFGAASATAGAPAPEPATAEVAPATEAGTIVRDVESRVMNYVRDVDLSKILPKEAVSHGR